MRERTPFLVLDLPYRGTPEAPRKDGPPRQWSSLYLYHLDQFWTKLSGGSDPDPSSVLNDTSNNVTFIVTFNINVIKL